MEMELVYKICPAALWRDAERAGSFLGSPADLADGFVHLSSAAQVAETARRHFGGETDLLLIAVDPAALGEALRWEPSRGGDPFPHLYGPLPLSAVRSVAPLPSDAEGGHDVAAALGRGGAPSRARGFDPAQAGWTRRQGVGFSDLVGPFWLKQFPEGTRYGILAETRHLNRGGVVHGGMVMTFADQALGLTALAMNPDRRQATIQLDTHFVSGIREGEFVEARCRVVRKTSSLLFLAGELAVGERVVATSIGVWKMAARPGRGAREQDAAET